MIAIALRYCLKKIATKLRNKYLIITEGKQFALGRNERYCCFGKIVANNFCSLHETKREEEEVTHKTLAKNTD